MTINKRMAEAIRKGSALVSGKKANKAFYEYDADGELCAACVLGAMALGIDPEANGLGHARGYVIDLIEKTFHIDVDTTHVPLPNDDQNAPLPAFYTALTEMSDFSPMTLEEIAEWIEQCPEITQGRL